MLTLLADISRYIWVSTLIEFEGLDELIKSIEGLADTTNIEKGIKKACLLVERAAKENASIDKGTGELANSITSEIKGLTGEVYTPLEYAPYREYGTGLYAENGKGRQDVPWVYVEGGSSKKSTKKYTQEEAKKAVAYLRKKGLDAHYTSGQHPQPFMRPALNDNREKILQLIREGMFSK